MGIIPPHALVVLGAVNSYSVGRYSQAFVCFGLPVCFVSVAKVVRVRLLKFLSTYNIMVLFIACQELLFEKNIYLSNGV